MYISIIRQKLNSESFPYMLTDYKIANTCYYDTDKNIDPIGEN